MSRRNHNAAIRLGDSLLDISSGARGTPHVVTMPTSAVKLRYHGEYGVEVQFLRQGELLIGRRLNTKALAPSSRRGDPPRVTPTPPRYPHPRNPHIQPWPHIEMHCPQGHLRVARTISVRYSHRRR